VTVDLRAFLDRGASFEGKVSFSGLLRIDGHLRGTAQSDGTLVVGETGVVHADLEVGTLLVRGSVTGAVRAQERVEIAPTGRLEGEVETPMLSVQEGGELQARVAMSAARSRVGGARRHSETKPEPSPP
jgi:cytoskeletal protein CcmA (bactofilin family)